MFLVRSNLDYASFVWALFDIHGNRVERMQWKFITFAMRGLRWSDLYDLPPYEGRGALLYIDTLFKSCIVACIIFVFDIRSRRVSTSCCPWCMWLLHCIIKLVLVIFFVFVSYAVFIWPKNIWHDINQYIFFYIYVWLFSSQIVRNYLYFKRILI
jgi:hypothetical protein